MHDDDRRGFSFVAYATADPIVRDVQCIPTRAARARGLERERVGQLVADGGRWRALIRDWPVRGPLDDELTSFQSEGRALWVMCYLLKPVIFRRARRGRSAVRGSVLRK